MDTYDSWTKNWRKWRDEWIDSEDKITCFVISAVPPSRIYTTRTHCELIMSISDFTNYKTSESNDIDCIKINDNTAIRPFVRFHTEKARKNFPKKTKFKGEIGMAITNMKSNDTPLDVLDNFGFISYELHYFTRVNILKTVIALETSGFGVLHDGGVVGSLEESVGEYSTRYKNRLPNRDDPVWLLLNRRLY